MPSISTMKFRLNRVTSMLIVGFFVLLTTGLMLSAYLKFEQMAQESAACIVKNSNYY